MFWRIEDHLRMTSCPASPFSKTDGQWPMDGPWWPADGTFLAVLSCIHGHTWAKCKERWMLDDHCPVEPRHNSFKPICTIIVQLNNSRVLTRRSFSPRSFILRPYGSFDFKNLGKGKQLRNTSSTKIRHQFNQAATSGLASAHEDRIKPRRLGIKSTGLGMKLSQETAIAGAPHSTCWRAPATSSWSWDEKRRNEPSWDESTWAKMLIHDLLLRPAAVRIATRELDLVLNSDDEPKMLARYMHGMMHVSKMKEGPMNHPAKILLVNHSWRFTFSMSTYLLRAGNRVRGLRRNLKNIQK